MKLALASLAAVLFFPPALSRSDEFGFAVAEKTRVRKTFEMDLKLESDAVTGKVGDQEIPEGMLEGFEMSMNRTETTVVADEYLRVEGGRPLELVRRFEELERRDREHQAKPGSEPEDKDETTLSDLAGHSVRFAWDEESEAYSKTWVGDEGDKALLEDLREDMDLRDFLPATPVAVDDTWELEGKTVLEAMPPGGDLGFPDKDGDDDDFDFEDAFEGRATATYEGTREQDGQRFAVITVALEGKAEKTREKDGGDQSFTVALDLDYELLWDLDAGRARSIEMTGDIEAVIIVSQKIEANGQQLPLEIKVDLSGKAVMKGTFEEE